MAEPFTEQDFTESPEVEAVLTHYFYDYYRQWADQVCRDPWAVKRFLGVINYQEKWLRARHKNADPAKDDAYDAYDREAYLAQLNLISALRGWGQDTFNRMAFLWNDPDFG